MAKAAVTRSIRDDHQKNFLKIFNGLTGKHSRWEIWEDFVTLTAIEISNSTDKVNATERTKMYQTIISKYSAKERDGMAEMLAEVVMGMEQNPETGYWKPSVRRTSTGPCRMRWSSKNGSTKRPNGLSS